MLSSSAVGVANGGRCHARGISDKSRKGRAVFKLLAWQPWKTAVIGLCAAGLAVPAAAATVNLATGLDASNTLISSGGQSDAHWTVSEQTGGTGAAQTVFPNNADWFGGWASNGPNSDWITRNANVNNNGPAPYTFTRTFDLTGLDPSTASITGSWAIDDMGTLDLNGHPISVLLAGAWGGLTVFAVPMGSPFFNSGLNSLNITITLDDQNLEGVRLEGTLSANPSTATVTPLPSSVWGGLLLLPVIAVMRLRWRQPL